MLLGVTWCSTAAKRRRMADKWQRASGLSEQTLSHAWPMSCCNQIHSYSTTYAHTASLGSHGRHIRRFTHVAIHLADPDPSKPRTCEPSASFHPPNSMCSQTTATPGGSCVWITLPTTRGVLYIPYSRRPALLACLYRETKAMPAHPMTCLAIMPKPTVAHCARLHSLVAAVCPSHAALQSVLNS